MDVPADLLIDGLLRHGYSYDPRLASVALFIWGYIKYQRHKRNLEQISHRVSRLELLNPIMFPLTQKTISGYRFGQKSWYTSNHVGVDYAASSGTELFAPFDGTIIWRGKGFQGGNTIHFKPNHDDVVIRFMHLKEMRVQNGQKVIKGQIIGLTGNTGFLTTGSHLHIDISRGAIDLGKPFPSNFIDPEQYNWDWQPQTYQIPVETPTENVPQVGTTDFVVVVASKVGSAHFRNEPTTKSPVFRTYPNGTEVWCNGVVEGETVNGSNIWFQSRKNKKFISSTVSRRK